MAHRLIWLNLNDELVDRLVEAGLVVAVGGTVTVKESKRMPYANVNDIRMYFEETGDPAATPLVPVARLQGAASSLRVILCLGAALAEAVVMRVRTALPADAVFAGAVALAYQHGLVPTP